MDKKGNKQWEELALDAGTNEIVSVYIGGRDEAAAQGLWNSLPPVDRKAGDAPPPVNVQSLTPISRLRFCSGSTPAKGRSAVGKERGKTSYIERLNNTRKTSSISFSAKNLVLFKIMLRITLVLFGILSTITMHHYLFSATPY
ncbi:MAG TPA: hypothetical protein DEV81_13475 [Cyanobacteria bacterium UBA11049]|nr:hypothetical protein [Cyanobacteria bacterium UBA11049]